MDPNSFNSFIDEERKRRQMQAMQDRMGGQGGGTATAAPKMSGRDIALSLLPFGTILDKLTSGQKVGMGEVGLEAALSLGPGKLLKGAKLLTTGAKAAKATKVTGRGLQFAQDVKKVAPEAANLVAAPGETVAKTTFRGRMVDRANQTLAGQYGTIPRPVARANDPSATFGTLADLGLTKPQDVERIGQAVTGTDGIINRAVLRATGSAARVKTDGLTRIATDALENNGVVEGGAKSVQAIINAQMKRLAGGPAGSIAPGAHPTDVLAVMKDIEKHIAQRTGKGGTYSLPTPASISEANALKQFRDELEGRLFEGAGANTNVTKVLTPEFRNELVSLHPDNAKWINHVDNVIMKSTDVKSLRSAQAPFVRANKIIDSADINAQTMGGRVGNLASPSPGNIASMIVDKTIHSSPARRAKAATLRFAGGADAVPGVAGGNKFTRGVNNLLGDVPGQPIRNVARMEARRGAGYSLLGGATDLQNSSMPIDLAQQPDGSFGLPGDPSAVDMAGGQPDNNQLAGGITREDVLAAMQADLQATGGKNIPELKTMYDVASAGAGANAKVTANQQKQLQGAAAAKGIVQSIEGRLAELPGGRLAGTLGKIEGKFGLNDAVSSYEQNRPTLALMLIKALQGSAGSISDADRNAIYSSIPSASDTGGERKRKIAQLHTLISVYQNSAQYQGGGQDQMQLPSSPGDVQFGY